MCTLNGLILNKYKTDINTLWECWVCVIGVIGILIGVLTSSFSDGVFVITINMDENGSKVGKIAMNVENSDVQVIKEIYMYKI